jgi:hypothetical protein
MSKASGHYRGLERIVSGGQTGVDRAALEVAIELGIPHGGWCPRGRLAENGPIPAKFELRETISPLYHIRTEQNVLDSDGTLILHRGKLKGGTLLTRRLAKTHGRPLLEFDVDAEPLPDLIFQWLRDHQIRILNVAGPRESSNPGVQSAAHVWLASLLANRPQNG